jgi:hypothetical protein
MKNLLMLGAVLILANETQAQKVSSENVPAPVMQAFKTKFSDAKKVKWEMDYENYEAEFKIKKSEVSATFDKEGKWLETESFVKPSELPKPVKEYLTKEFGELSAYKIESAEKQEKESSMQYELMVKKGEHNYVMHFSDKGEFISKEDRKEADKKD